ncbi:MAG: formate--tetrahydrofolate ligase [Rikenellaceae bacterium]|nr:formate--tetrahydrofolate ligase [Rikenellaceae bacterium]
MNEDLRIAHSVELEPIVEIASRLGIGAETLESYGRYKAKLPLSLIDANKIGHSNLILVSAISPTPAGEGKTTVSIGLSQALCRLGYRSVVALREPSLGPVFGIKGGAAGGGYSQVLPMEDINLNFTGDFDAVSKAHNLLSAMIDNNIQNKNNNLGIDPRTVVWKRVIDMNDRALRNIIVGLGGATGGRPRETGFDITAASEVMAILCMSESMKELKERLGNIFVGYTFDRKPVYARDLKAEGAMAVILKEAIKPNLVQTIEHTPAIIHGGPFANIAQGTNTIVATKMAMSLSEYAVTEAGFGFDLGGEKFIDIKCRRMGVYPKAVVLVATIKALKYHGGKPLSELSQPDVEALKRGMVNLAKHIENIRRFDANPIVAINRFNADSQEEIDEITRFCQSEGVPISLCEVWAKGGEGGIDLAEKVVAAIKNNPSECIKLYGCNLPVKEKIEKIAREIYGAAAVEYTGRAEADIKRIYSLGHDKLPICIAKTQKSLSDDPKLLGRPTGFVMKIREVELAAGAGFIIPIAGEMMRMPGLPEVPAAEMIDIDENGEIVGLS